MHLGENFLGQQQRDHINVTGHKMIISFHFSCRCENGYNIVLIFKQINPTCALIFLGNLNLSV